MNSYKPSQPRAAFTLASVALAVLSIGVFVGAPAQFGAPSADAQVVARRIAPASAPVQVAVIPSIEVVAVRERADVSGGYEAAPGESMVALVGTIKLAGNARQGG